VVIVRARRANSTKYFAGLNRIEIPSGLKLVFGTEKAPLSARAVAGFMKYAASSAFFMKLRRESAESGDCSGAKGEFNQVSAGRNRIEIPSGLKVVFGTKKVPLSALAVAGFMKYAGPKGEFN
jgi:Sec-independent protein translocase protein TatA